MSHKLDIQIEQEVMLRVPCDHWHLFSPGDMLNGPVWIRDNSDPCEHERCYPRNNPTDYSDSLDAAFEMEEEIKRRGLHRAYCIKMRRMVFGGMESLFDWGLVHATAEQRCEAALEAVKQR